MRASAGARRAGWPENTPVRSRPSASASVPDEAVRAASFSLDAPVCYGPAAAGAGTGRTTADPAHSVIAGVLMPTDCTARSMPCYDSGSDEERDVEIISQRQLRNDSGEILRRASTGERFRIRAGSGAVDLHAAHLTVIEQLTAAGRLSPPGDDDFADFPGPGTGVEPLERTIDAVRADR